MSSSRHRVRATFAPGVAASSPPIAIDRDAPAAARHYVDRVLGAADVGADQRSVVELLVSEVVSNVVRHEDSSMIDLAVTLGDRGDVTVTVSGRRTPPSVRLVHPPGRPDASSESGRGLDVLDSLAWAWGTRRQDRRTAVWFTVAGSGAGPVSAELGEPAGQA